MELRHTALAAITAIFLIAVSPAVAQLVASRIDTPLGPNGPRLGRFSDRTLVLAIEMDRDTARIVAYTVKQRPFVRDLAQVDASLYVPGRPVQIEVVLLGPGGQRYTQRVEAGPLCLSHDGGTEPHVEGDTVYLHRDSFVVEVPELAGFDRVEVAFHEEDAASRSRRVLGSERFDRARFQAAAGSLAYDDLAFADPDATDWPAVPTSSTLTWPEDYGDSDIYQTYGEPSEGAQRINIVIVPDGYTYAEKSVMEGHADAMVQWFRGKTPHVEHDPFMNYTLVYAYSLESGTDQCDCDIVVDTAMGTRFLEPNPQCGHSDNRCLYYGGGCDTSGSANISAAELRAPFHDETIVMVNTPRYGGCGGSRAVYSAGDSAAVEVAVHELGHSLAGLADEYAYNPACGGGGGGINTSSNPLTGAWPEWIDDLGAPWEGAQYFQQCIYRPLPDCEMRSLNQPFCPVCNQRWSLLTFGHPRVAATAPVSSSTPPSGQPLEIYAGVATDFAVETRLSAGASVTNGYSWWVSRPGFPPSLLSNAGPSYTLTVPATGLYTLSVDVVADTNFVKPEKYGANSDNVTWEIDAVHLNRPDEISPPGAADPLLFTDKQTLEWEDGASKRAFEYNVYVGELSALAGGSYGGCELAGVEEHQGVTLPSAAEPPPGVCWTYLVTGDNPTHEGTMGADSAGGQRANTTPCD